MPASSCAVFPARRRRRTGALAALAAGLVLSSLAIPPSAAGQTAVTGSVPAATAEQQEAAAQVAAAAVPQLRWRACGGGVECATARVPLDYDRPNGATITLALARVPATEPRRRIGSVFLNPGGPGGSGVDLVKGLGQVLFSDDVRARFDLVGFDPRGIAASTPLRCFNTVEDAIAATAPLPFPVTKQEEDLWIAADRRIAAACTRRAGAVLDHMSTGNVARDMDLLRRAVGDAKTTFVGYSYGSYVGSTYANLFPDKVRSVVIDGVIDPVSWATGRGNEARTRPVDTRLESAQGAFETLQQFLSLCDRGGPNCAFSGGDPRVRYDRLADRLLAEPAQLPDGQGGTVPFTYNDFVAISLGVMYDPGVWPFFAEFLQQLAVLTRPEQAAVALEAVRRRLGAADKAPEDYQNFVEGGRGVTCSDSDNPNYVGAWRRAADESEREHPYFGRIWTWFSSICVPWPGADADRFTGPFTAVTASPVLVIGNRFDPATRYQDAVRTDDLLARSRLLTLEGWGHTSLFKSSCVDRYVERYLLTSRVPPEGAACRPDAVPFTEPITALRTAEEASPLAFLIPPQILRPADR